MCNLATMKRQRLWLFRQGFTIAAAHMQRAIDSMTQGETP